MYDLRTRGRVGGSLVNCVTSTMKTNRSRIFLLTAIVIATGLGCSAVFGTQRAFQGPSNLGYDAQNGERIYFTATNADGERISYRGGPSFGGMMMGSYLTCAACHGPEAGGGTHSMHMQLMDAPAITYTALTAEGDAHGDAEGDAHTDEHAEEHGSYDLEAFRMAVVEGKHPDGKSLSRDMPRWRMNDEDLADLFEFLKSLP
jgi:hypothetical protein